jgi:hypothetical protein
LHVCCRSYVLSRKVGGQVHMAARWTSRYMQPSNLIHHMAFQGLYANDQEVL